MRRLILGAIAIAFVLGGALAFPHRVSAHALRQSSVPADGAVLDTAPAEVLITFGEEPDPRLSHVDVLDTSGTAHQQGSLTAVAGNPRELRVAVGPLAKGVYTVSWSTVSAVDGHRAAGAFAFGIGVTAQQVQTAGTTVAGQSASYNGRPSALTVVGRWALYLGLFGLTGAAFVGALVLPTTPRSQLSMASAGLGVALIGTALVIGVEVADAGVGLGDLAGSSLGRASIERAVSMLASAATVAAALLWSGRRRRIALALAGGCAAAAMLTDVSASHAAAADSLVIINVALQWFHILAAAAWIGGLAALLLALRDPEVAGGRGNAVRRFSTGAGIALAVVLVTGVIRAAVEIGSWGSVLSTDFGRLVIIKFSLISVLAALGAINRWRHVGRIPARLQGLRRVGSGELAVASLAVLVASALVNLAPPVSANSSSAPAPPGPLEITASDYATTVKVTLTVSPGAAGFNEFTARVADYDSGAPVDALGVQLDFSLPIAPDVGASTLTLPRTAPGVYTARGGNLSLDGSWKVTALVQRGAQSVEIPLTVATHSPPQRIDVTRIAGESVDTIHLGGNRTVQVYVDPPGPGKVDVHATFFDASGNGLPMTSCMIVGTPPSGQPEAYPVRLFDVGHYIASANVVRGAYRFDIAGVTATGERLTTHLDATVPAS